jgi:hypothetical protein
VGLSALDGWVPIRLHERAEPVVEWCWLDGAGFDEQSFVQTVERAFLTPFSLLFRQETPVDALDDLEPGLAPSGFVLHGSRCGSTLVARMLAAAHGTLVVAEPAPVDQALRAGASEEERIRWLRGLVSALGRPRREERSYVLKLDAWSACSLGTIRSAFPDVPWVFLFRDPVRVLASHFRQRGAHMVPGAIDPALFGFEPGEAERVPPEEFCARVLAAIYRSALEHRDGGALYVDYADLPGAVAGRILPAFGLEHDPRMDEVTAFDAKTPTVDYRPSEHPATPALEEAAGRWVGPLYEHLRAC